MILKYFIKFFFNKKIILINSPMRSGTTFLAEQIKFFILNNIKNQNEATFHIGDDFLINNANIVNFLINLKKKKIIVIKLNGSFFKILNFTTKYFKDVLFISIKRNPIDIYISNHKRIKNSSSKYQIIEQIIDFKNYLNKIKSHNHLIIDFDNINKLEKIFYKIQLFLKIKKNNYNINKKFLINSSFEHKHDRSKLLDQDEKKMLKNIFYLENNYNISIFKLYIFYKLSDKSLLKIIKFYRKSEIKELESIFKYVNNLIKYKKNIDSNLNLKIRDIYYNDKKLFFENCSNVLFLPLDLSKSIIFFRNFFLNNSINGQKELEEFYDKNSYFNKSSLKNYI